MNITIKEKVRGQVFAKNITTGHFFYWGFKLYQRLPLTSMSGFIDYDPTLNQIPVIIWGGSGKNNFPSVIAFIATTSVIPVNDIEITALL